MAFVSDNLAYIDLLTEFAHTTGSTVALAVGAPRWHAWLQFGLQFTTVPCRPERTGQRRWSSLNRSERPRAELLMLLRSRAVQALAVCCQYCCQAAGHGLSRTDNSGASAQHMTGNGRSWTICPRARPFGIVVVIFLLSGIRVLREWERMPVLRLGRYIGLKGPGLIYLIPLIDRAPLKISTRLDTIQFRTESTLTKDNVPVNVDSVLYMKPVDLEKAVLNVENYYQATQLASQTTLREVIGKQSLNELLAEREKVGAHLREIIDEKTEAWGIKVTAVEVRDVIIPSNLQDAMSRQAQAERERMARVTLATAEFEASQK